MVTKNKARVETLEKPITPYQVMLRKDEFGPANPECWPTIRDANRKQATKIINLLIRHSEQAVIGQDELREFGDPAQQVFVVPAAVVGELLRIVDPRHYDGG